MSPRVVVTCADGHKLTRVAAFAWLQDIDPGSPDVGQWAWKWDNEPASVGHGPVSEGGMHRWYSTPKHPATEVAPDGTWKVVLHCPRCSRHVVRSWEQWTDALEKMAPHLSTIGLSDLDRGNVGSKRGS